MSPLTAFLGGRPAPRPNGGTQDYALQHRHAEGGPWRTLAVTATPEAAEDEALGTREDLAHGDLLRVRWRFMPTTLSTWVASLQGPVKIPPLKRVFLPSGSQDWEEGWGSADRTEAEHLVVAGDAGVDRGRLVLAGVACVRPLLGVLPVDPATDWAVEAMVSALREAEDWAHGRRSPSDRERLLRAIDGASRASINVPREMDPQGALRAAASAAWRVASAATAEGMRVEDGKRSDAWYVEKALYRVEEAWNALRSFSETYARLGEAREEVVRAIPLSVLLLGFAGEAVPPEGSAAP